MSKNTEFYQNYVHALFKRGKAQKLPLTYLYSQAEKVLNPDEITIFSQIIDSMLEQGALLREDDLLFFAEPRA